ncbi:transketolase [Aspergillus arachidicola]|uniref:Transketolase n=1 Tax=Aspergillus arachidicola TaxID=656916 RepID=A0A2G7EM70_9EURO|nr:transketolase [Aspergillus arachidicola]
MAVGPVTINGSGKSALPLVQQMSKDHDIVLKTFRMLISDLCQQFGGGHPGYWRHWYGRYRCRSLAICDALCSSYPRFFNRDRFILSNGHTCLFQYSFLHLTGYKAMTFDQLKSYHSDRVDALCPGHPEIEHEGIEVTTGPLGQGVANAVGLAMATKNLAAKFNQPGYDVVNNHTWCMIGDACLQEGVGLEAISYAGHLKLNNLTIIYDNNQITCDGSVDLTNTEDINGKMRASGWDVIDVEDGCYDVEGLVRALEQARASTEKPTFINVRTVIGLGSNVAGQAAAHGAAFGAPNVAQMKKENGFNPDEHFVIGETVRKFFEDLPARGESLVQEWKDLVKQYTAQYPELGAEFQRRMSGELPSNWKDLIPASFPEKPTASRASSGLVFNPIAKEIENFMVGTADLSPSVNMIWPGKVDFQHPDLRTTCGINGNYGGRYIHYGVREHAMCAISNGLAAYAPNTFIPITSSFFMFYLYAAPAVRMGALQHLQIIHAATHDSIETAGAWIAAIEAKKTPTIISTSRHTLPQLKQTSRDGVARGAYVLEEAENAAVTLIGVGAELSFALEVANKLKEKGVVARVVSFPCQRLFEQQSLEYKRSVLQRHRGIPAVVIEPYAPNGWERYADAGVCIKRFGHSLPGKVAYKYFGYDIDTLTEKVHGYLGQVEKDELLKHEFVEL